MNQSERLLQQASIVDAARNGKIMTSPVKPTVGRIVIYHHPGSADGKYAADISPAIVRKVDELNSDRVQIFVFGPKGQHQDWSDFGEGPSQWSWPERG